MKSTQQLSTHFRVAVSTVRRAQATRGGGRRFRRCGGSSVAAVAYQTGQSMYCARLKRTYSYPRPAEEIIATDLIVPDFAPAWACDRHVLWKRNELHNKRKDARVAISAIVSIQQSLGANRQSAVAAVRELARRIVRRFSVAVDFAVHAPSARGDARNFHAHFGYQHKHAYSGRFWKQGTGLRHNGSAKKWDEARQGRNVCRARSTLVGGDFQFRVGMDWSNGSSRSAEPRSPMS